MAMDRRDFMAVLGATAVVKWGSVEAIARSATAPLKQLADQKGLLFGSSLALKYFDQSPAYKQLFVSQCDIATPELHIPRSMRPRSFRNSATQIKNPHPISAIGNSQKS